MPLKSFIKAIVPILETNNTVPTIEYKDWEKKKEMNILEHKNKLKWMQPNIQPGGGGSSL